MSFPFCPVVLEYLRDFQLEGLESINNYFLTNKGNPCICLPTGTGKSYLNAGFIVDTMYKWPTQRILTLTHVKTIIEQNQDKLLKLWPNAPVGIYSAGMGRKDIIQPIISGSVQSVASNPEVFGHRDIILIDECFSPDTEILTEKGFIRFDKLGDENVAQYSSVNGDITFCKPTNKIIKYATEGLFKVESDNNFDLLVTPKHEMLVNGKKIVAEKVVKASYNKIKVAGFATGYDDVLQPWEKFAICYQADGSLHKENVNGSSITAFSFSKERKIKEFLSMMVETGFEFREVSGKSSNNPKVKPRRRFMVYLPAVPDKTIDHYFNISSMSLGKCKSIIEYMNLWDGSVASKNTYVYSSTNEKMVDFYQAVATLAGYKSKKVKIVDNRSETFSDCYKLFINLSVDYVSTQSWKPTRIPYDDLVYCVSVPSGNIITRRGGKTIITGNCHLVSPKDGTMYQEVVKKLTEINPYLKVIGMSATPYRLGQGMITDDGLFTDICFDLTGVESFNRFIALGYLSPLVAQPTKVEVDTSNIRIVNGDFAKGQSDAEVDKILYEGLKEFIERSYDRHSWLLFTAGIKSSEHAAEILNGFGIDSVAIHSKLTTAECDKRFELFKTGKIRAICGANKFVTGFDHPPIDAIGDFSPTISPGKHVQKAGRGTRPYDCNNKSQYISGFDYVKRNCLFLDFAGNTKRNGPINDPRIPRKKGKGTGEVPIKICEECGTYNHAAARFCCNPDCNVEFKFQTKLTNVAYTGQIIKSEAPILETFDVSKVIYHRHDKVGSMPTIKVSYFSGLKRFTEYVCLEHKGFARRKAESWWKQRHNSEPPKTTDEALSIITMLRTPKRIRVWTNKKYAEIMQVEW
jgi:DNA repair protein RadD